METRRRHRGIEAVASFPSHPILLFVIIHFSPNHYAVNKTGIFFLISHTYLLHPSLLLSEMDKLNKKH